MPARVDHVVTSGTFSLDGGTWEVDNNVWIVGDDSEAIVIDAAHDADAIAAAVGDRRLVAIVSTHGHDDHIDAAPALSARTGAPVLLHPGDLMLWKQKHPDRSPDGELSDGQVITVAGTGLTVLHTPGHSPGAVCLHAPDLGTVFSGDTLFSGGPGATGRQRASAGEAAGAGEAPRRVCPCTASFPRTWGSISFSRVLPRWIAAFAGIARRDASTPP